jgi:hypothetical protein
MSKDEYKNSLMGILCKFQLLNSSKDEYHFIIYKEDNILNIKEIQKKLKFKKLQFAENDTLEYMFKCKKEELNILSLISGIREEIRPKLTILIEEGLNCNEFLCFNPFRLDTTATITYSDMIKILEEFSFKTQLF